MSYNETLDNGIESGGSPQGSSSRDAITDIILGITDGSESDEDSGRQDDSNMDEFGDVDDEREELDPVKTQLKEINDLKLALQKEREELKKQSDALTRKMTEIGEETKRLLQESGIDKIREEAREGHKTASKVGDSFPKEFVPRDYLPDNVLDEAVKKGLLPEEQKSYFSRVLRPILNYVVNSMRNELESKYRVEIENVRNEYKPIKDDYEMAKITQQRQAKMLPVVERIKKENPQLHELQLKALVDEVKARDFLSFVDVATEEEILVRLKRAIKDPDVLMAIGEDKRAPKVEKRFDDIIDYNDMSESERKEMRRKRKVKEITWDILGI